MCLRLALALGATLAVAGPGWADVPRCMAMAHVRTVDRTERITLRDGETIGPLLRIEGDRQGLWLCSENHTCWPAADFDLVTPCTPDKMQGSTVTMR